MSDRWKKFRARNAASPIPPHAGSVNFYDNHRCRCEGCKAAKKVKMDRYRKRLLTQALESQQKTGTCAPP